MGRPRRIQDTPEELSRRIDGYFQQCYDSREEITLKSNDKRIRQTLPSMVGLAVYLGISKASLYEYLDGKYDEPIDNTNGNSGNSSGKYTETYSDVLARARDRIELETLNAASNGDTDSRITLARLAKFGYSTKVETETKAELTVKWEGVDTSDIDAWGK